MTRYLSKPPPGVQLNHNHPLSQGLMGCWHFNEGSGLRVNDLCGMNFGTLQNFEPFSNTSKWTGGKYGTSLQFDGTNDVVSIGNSPSLSIANNLTIKALIFPTNVSPGYDQRIVTKVVSPATRGYDFFIQSATSKIFLGVDNAGGGTASTGTLTSNQWVDVAVVFNDTANTTSYYINGALDSTTTQNASITQNTANPLIGNFTGLVRNFIGIISSVMIWNRSLNSTEIQNIYAQPYEIFNFR